MAMAVYLKLHTVKSLFAAYIKMILVVLLITGKLCFFIKLYLLKIITKYIHLL